MGDRYPAATPTNVDRAAVYDDGAAYPPPGFVTDSAPGATYRKLDVAAARYAARGTHTGLADW